MEDSGTPLPRRSALVQRRAMKVREALARWEKKLQAARRRVAKLRKRVAYYDRLERRDRQAP